MNKKGKVEKTIYLLSKKKGIFYIPLLCMEFMVSIGANPIVSIRDENKFPIGSKLNSYPLSRGNRS